MANIVVDNILALLEGRRPPNIVNPEVLARVTRAGYSRVMVEGRLGQDDEAECAMARP